MYLSNGFKFENLFEIIIEFVKFSPAILKQQLVEVLDADKLISSGMCQLLAIDLGEDMEILGSDGCTCDAFR